MPCIERSVKGRTTRRESQVIRTIPSPQVMPTSLCSHLMTSLKRFSIGLRMFASRSTDERLWRSSGIGGLLRQMRAIGSGSRSHAGSGSRRELPPSGPLGAGGRIAEEAPIGELVEAAVAEWVAAQQPPGGQDQAPDRSQLADRLDRVLGATRVVAAAGGERRRDPALVEPDRGDQQGGRQAFHDKRSSPAASLINSASEARTPSLPSRSSRPSAPGRAATPERDRG